MELLVFSIVDVLCACKVAFQRTIVFSLPYRLILRFRLTRITRGLIVVARSICFSDFRGVDASQYCDS